MYKFCNGDLPTYLNDLFPVTVENSTPYALRNANDINSVLARTNIYASSVIPSCVNAWNALDLNIRDSPTLNIFKYRLKHLYKPRDLPVYFYLGQRYTSVIHARLRNHCSHLNSDLYKNHLRNNEHCECGHLTEDIEHYIFTCPNYTQARQKLFQDTRQYHPLSTDKLLQGIRDLNKKDSEKLINSFHAYINSTKRFT